MKKLIYYPVHKVYTNKENKGLDKPELGDEIEIYGTTEKLIYSDNTIIEKYDIK